jgi:molecular chaperone HtpG
MKDMSQIGGGMNFYGELPNSYNIVVNQNHPIIAAISDEMVLQEGSSYRLWVMSSEGLAKKWLFLRRSIHRRKAKRSARLKRMTWRNSEKNLMMLREKEMRSLRNLDLNIKVRQLVDLALLANNMLKGEELSNFVNRSVGLL